MSSEPTSTNPNSVLNHPGQSGSDPAKDFPVSDREQNSLSYDNTIRDARPDDFKGDERADAKVEQALADAGRQPPRE